MISYLIGKPIIYLDELIILVGGVGYGVKATNQTLTDSSGKEEIALHIYTHVKEDALVLFGFNSINDKELFKLLISVSGVGPATAMSILNKGSQQIITAIQNADVSFFTSVKRVGKKAGQKIIIDLKTKLGGLKDLDLTPLNQMQSDILEALMSLGFGEEQIHQVIKGLDLKDMPLEKAVQMAIKELGKNK
ncbi:MAG: Holliday junction DNA helicase RuvA [Candidatus Pacebacteria bacterium CG1_02_43_31]|nr:Holliday junction branch migration protein RuvA [Candidatus Pacearchaeota archaeon]NCQ65449.1 Holliday junction branch migration protein RuvA [Candidatus Paceibacterota bacterium]OIO45149.1 MAG: Holliday junction DNA helicase RuvA [Candidatus Pacebacteria bacterium CG1_02_43_31]PIQ81390.1 MAG: Holliday junction branch migration protein RuvA [Candidatus Pacebacteria bacterium CG11_big_fil_rev_8_21_14_0_20_34_55]PJC43921.1 MAG: Holliday junction branch migration protein RuvA [Candidatus Paceba